MDDVKISVQDGLEHALAHHQAGRLSQAEGIYRQILAVDPLHADSQHLLGVIALQVGRNDLAIDYIKGAIKNSPNTASYHVSLSVALKNANRIAEAAGICQKALRLDPNSIDGYLTLGHIFQTEKRWSLAEKPYRSAIQLAPGHPPALMSLANCLQEQGYFQEAEHYYNEVLKLAPEFAEAHKNYGVALVQRGLLKKALASYREAIRLNPHEPAWRMALGQILLLDGQYEEGWHHYEWRWQTKGVPSQPRGFRQPLWEGEDIGDKVLLLHAEQGYGDTIQFCRYITDIAAKMRVVLEVQKPLINLLKFIPGVEKIIATGDPLPDFDFHCPLLTLPKIKKTHIGNIPNQVPYLKADPDKIKLWEKRLSHLSGLKVGLAWAGGSVTPRNTQRSITVHKLSILSKIQNVSFVSLQKYQLSSMVEPNPQGLDMQDWTESLTDFADTAALIQGLDLIISVDTAVAHVAGALGRPVWLLNRFSPCWRWLLSCSDSPWYPTLRQFRQPTLNDWDSVLHLVRYELERLAAGETVHGSSQPASCRRSWSDIRE